MNEHQLAATSLSLLEGRIYLHLVESGVAEFGCDNHPHAARTPFRLTPSLLSRNVRLGAGLRHSAPVHDNPSAEQEALGRVASVIAASELVGHMWASELVSSPKGAYDFSPGTNAPIHEAILTALCVLSTPSFGPADERAEADRLAWLVARELLPLTDRHYELVATVLTSIESLVLLPPGEFRAPSHAEIVEALARVTDQRWPAPPPWRSPVPSRTQRAVDAQVIRHVDDEGTRFDVAFRGRRVASFALEGEALLFVASVLFAKTPGDPALEAIVTGGE